MQDKEAHPEENGRSISDADLAIILDRAIASGSFSPLDFRNCETPADLKQLGKMAYAAVDRVPSSQWQEKRRVLSLFNAVSGERLRRGEKTSAELKTRIGDLNTQLDGMGAEVDDMERRADATDTKLAGVVAEADEALRRVQTGTQRVLGEGDSI